ncbi:hypothetical protein COE17_10290 [Bacillus thuringiensis]|nr:hypothetical protein COJ26_09725 [Bacillus thuringiensis]PGT67536.1 hypothetical protein COD12_08185 [Bacillus thuringiensis]PGW41596.1 hypothetical protein COE17_10290 [Bacillus thuringiensis]
MRTNIINQGGCYMVKHFGLGALFISIGLLAACSQEEEVATKVPFEDYKPSQGYINEGEFEALEDDMTREEVAQLIGGVGELYKEEDYIETIIYKGEGNIDFAMPRFEYSKLDLWNKHDKE